MDTNLAVEFIQKFQKEVIANQWIDGNKMPPENKDVLVEIKRQDKEKSPIWYSVARYEKKYGWNIEYSRMSNDRYISRWMFIPE